MGGGPATGFVCVEGKRGGIFFFKSELTGDPARGAEIPYFFFSGKVH